MINYPTFKSLFITKGVMISLLRGMPVIIISNTLMTVPGEILPPTIVGNSNESSGSSTLH